MVSTVSPLRIGLWDPFQLPQMAYNWGVTNYIRYLGWSSKHPISLASDPSKSLFFRRSQRWSWIVFQDPASEYLWQNFAVEKIRGHYLGPHFFFGGGRGSNLIQTHGKFAGKWPIFFWGGSNLMQMLLVIVWRISLVIVLVHCLGWYTIMIPVTWAPVKGV